MSLVYKCDFYATTTSNPNAYKHLRQLTIDKDDQDQPLTINGVVCELGLSLEIKVPASSEQIHASVPAWKDAAQLLKAWLDATFP